MVVITDTGATWWSLMRGLSMLYFSTIHGRIDQVKQVLELDQESAGLARYTALDKWTTQLQSLHLSVVNKMA